MVRFSHDRWANPLHENCHGPFQFIQATTAVKVQLELIQARFVLILFNIAGNIFDGAMTGHPIAVGTQRVFTRNFREINPKTHTDFRRFGPTRLFTGR